MLEVLFHPDKEDQYLWLKIAWIIGLFLFGIYLWGKFLNWNTLTLNFYDCGKLNTLRLKFLQNAYKLRQWPLHMANDTALLGLTDRFLILPDVVIIPQTLLLLVLDIPTFVMVDVLIHYAIGFSGLLWLRQRLRLSLFAFTAFVFLFTFNGHVLAHYRVGHFNWRAYFLHPSFLYIYFVFLTVNRGGVG